MNIQKNEAFEAHFKSTQTYCRECAIRGKDILEFSKTMGGYFNIVANDAWNMWQAAKAQAVTEAKPSHSITLTCAQLREAFMFGAPDEDDQEQLETEMTITWSEEGHSGKGYYCYYSELPEEGAIFLDEVIEAQEQKG